MRHGLRLYTSPLPQKHFNGVGGRFLENMSSHYSTWINVIKCKRNGMSAVDGSFSNRVTSVNSRGQHLTSKGSIYEFQEEEDFITTAMVAQECVQLLLLALRGFIGTQKRLVQRICIARRDLYGRRLHTRRQVII